jgi:hypothetical protein
MSGRRNNRREYSPNRHQDREKEKEEDATFHARERQFHRKQMIERTQLRVRERRIIPFDLLFVNTVKCGLYCERNPIEIVPRVDPKELVMQIENTLEYEENEPVREYWRVILDWIAFLGEPHGPSRTSEGVQGDIRKMLGAKDYEGLCKLEVAIRKKLRSKELLDPDYWEELLSELGEFKRRERLVEITKELVSTRKEEGAKPITQFEENAMDQNLKEPDTKLDDSVDNSVTAIRLFEAASSVGHSSNQVPFSNEALDIPERIYPYRSIRPRYIALVYMRVEWTKYNLAHYTTDNPPLAKPFGFCFQIFYPLLKEGVPTYSTEPDPAGSETQILRIRAGEPYADLVFRIPAQHWELGHRAGFQCVYEGATFKLEFRFKAYHYSRF